MVIDNTYIGRPAGSDQDDNPDVADRNDPEMAQYFNCPPEPQTDADMGRAARIAEEA